jgi:hypothetical protein
MSHAAVSGVSMMILSVMIYFISKTAITFLSYHSIMMMIVIPVCILNFIFGVLLVVPSIILWPAFTGIYPINVFSVMSRNEKKMISVAKIKRTSV